jgi:hypothetical protein
MQQTGCGECVATLLLSQRPVLLETQPEHTGQSNVCLVLSTALDIQLLQFRDSTHSPDHTSRELRCESLDDAVYLARHIWFTHQRVEGLAPLERNAVSSPLGAVDGQYGAKNKFCVRLTSTWFSQDACLGV